MRKILLYGIKTEDRLKELIDAGEKFGAEALVVGNEDLDTIVSDLLEDNNKELIDEDLVFDTEYMMMVNFGEDLDDYLNYLKEEEKSVPLISMLTETSKNWTLGYLIEHILEERQIVQAYRASKGLISYCKSITKNNPDPEIDGLIGEMEIQLDDPKQMDVKVLSTIYQELYEKIQKYNK